MRNFVDLLAVEYGVNYDATKGNITMISFLLAVIILFAQ
ncbi:MAG: hypothetical protein ACTS8H_01250 [Arsenophonus sp. NC-PE1-MAG3]